MGAIASCIKAYRSPRIGRLVLMQQGMRRRKPREAWRASPWITAARLILPRPTDSEGWGSRTGVRASFQDRKGFGPFFVPNPFSLLRYGRSSRRRSVHLIRAAIAVRIVRVCHRLNIRAGYTNGGNCYTAHTPCIARICLCLHVLLRWLWRTRSSQEQGQGE